MASANREAYQRLLDAAEFQEDMTSDRSRQAMRDAFAPDIVITIPECLPHGGVHEGVEAWASMNDLLEKVYEVTVNPEKIWDVPEDDVIILYSRMEYRSRATGKAVKFPAIEVLHFRDLKICGAELFFQDTKAMLDILE